jgi:hypothetical protein
MVTTHHELNGLMERFREVEVAWSALERHGTW